MTQIACPSCGATIETSDTVCPYCSTALPAPSVDLPPTLRIDRDLFSGNLYLNVADSANFRAVRELLAQGKKIEAIKAYREITGAGLKEAKDAIEALEAGQPVIVPIDATQASGSGLPGEADRGFQSSAEAMDAIKAELRAGRKLMAIQLHRTHFSTSLAEARAAVEQIEASLPFESVRLPDVEIPAFARPDEPGINANPFDKPQQPPSSTRKWIIGCSIAAVVFLCLCICLPIAIFILSGQAQ